jgi:hypothetical protein
MHKTAIDFAEIKHIAEFSLDDYWKRKLELSVIFAAIPLIWV